MGTLASRGGSRWLLLAVLVMAGFVGLAWQGAQSSADDPAQQAASAARERSHALLAGAVPVASLATETSKTYRRPDGKFVTRVFSQPTDAETSLTPVADGYEADGHGTTTHFPTSLADPITVTRGDAKVSMRLLGGGRGAGRPSGSSITYDKALPGVSVTYQSSHGAVGEDLHLDGAGAPARYVFEVRASAGVRAAAQRNGTIALTDADGRRVVALSPSYAFADRKPTATHKVTTALTALDGGGWRVTLSVDEGWLRAALADGPVTIDPTLELQGAAKDCSLTSDTPTLSFCSDSQLWVGWSGDHDHHSLVKWDVSAIPKDALVLSGDVGLYQSGSTVPVAKPLTIHRVTRDWTNGASWNSYDGTHAWTTPGGDYDPTPAATQNDPAYNNGWVDWYATGLVQRWVDGGLPNYGVLVKDQSPPHVTGEEDFGSSDGGGNPATMPELDIIWTTRGGAADAYTFESEGLDVKTGAAVNAANGNLLLTTKDVAIPGLGGLDLAFNHYHNSIADPTVTGGVGRQTTGSFGRDVSLRPLYGPDLVFSRGDGLMVAFSNPHTTGTTKTFDPPADLLGATLTQSTSTNLYTLDLPSGTPAWPGLHLVLTFDPDGALTKIADPAGHHLDLDYYPSGYTNPPAVGGILDTNGDRYDIDRSGDGEESVDNIADPADAHHWTFAYDPVYGTLTKATSIDTTNYRYAYDSLHRLTKVTGPTGAVTLFTYNGTTPKVATVVQTTDAAHTTGPTTTFTYSSPSSPCLSGSFDFTKTVVQRPNGTSTTYCANDHAQITYDTDDPTAATPSGEWYDLHDQYTAGTGTRSVTLTGADAGAGVKKLTLERVGGADVASATLACDPRNAPSPTACPHAATQTVSFDAASLPEGADVFRQATTDYAGRVKRSAEWVVKVDRSAPTAPSAPDLADYDDQTQTAIVAFTGGADPALADGQPGSGVGRSEIRYRIGAGAWTGWTTTVDDQAVITGVAVGTTIAIELRTIDAVGNVSGVTSGSLVAEVPDADFIDFPINAATGADAAVEVVLHLPEGDAVPAAGLPVTVADGNGQHATIRTDGDGVAYFSGLAAGDHLAYTPQAAGTEEISDQHLFVTPGTLTTHRIDLRIQGADYGEGVTAFGLPSSDSDGAQEIKDCLNNFPVKICWQWLGDALRADSVASTLFGTLGVVADSTRANSFKHSYAVSLFVRTMITKFDDDGPPHWGYDYARLHEIKDRESPNIDKRRASFMDTNNNLVALNYTTDHPTRNMAQLCTTMRTKAKNARYVDFPNGADDVDVPPNNQRTRLIYIRPYDPDVDGSGNPTDGGFFPESKPCKYALQRYAEQ